MAALKDVNDVVEELSLQGMKEMTMRYHNNNNFITSK